MKLSELYKTKVEWTSKSLSHLKGCYYNHLPELTNTYETEFNGYDALEGLEEFNDKIEIRYHVDHNFDGRRVWTLATVWYDNHPVMAIQNAGREGDDHYERFISNKALFEDMVLYIVTLVVPEDNRDKTITFDHIEELSADIDLVGLDNFYGYSIDTVRQVFF